VSQHPVRVIHAGVPRERQLLLSVGGLASHQNHSACAGVLQPGLLKITSNNSVFSPSAQTAARKMRLSHWFPSLIASLPQTKAPANIVIARTMPKRKSTRCRHTNTIVAAPEEKTLMILFVATASTKGSRNSATYTAVKIVT